MACFSTKPSVAPVLSMHNMFLAVYGLTLFMMNWKNGYIYLHFLSFLTIEVVKNFAHGKQEPI